MRYWPGQDRFGENYLFNKLFRTRIETGHKATNCSTSRNHLNWSDCVMFGHGVFT